MTYVHTVHVKKYLHTYISHGILVARVWVASHSYEFVSIVYHWRCTLTNTFFFLEKRHFVIGRGEILYVLWSVFFHFFLLTSLYYFIHTMQYPFQFQLRNMVSPRITIFIKLFICSLKNWQWFFSTGKDLLMQFHYSQP